MAHFTPDRRQSKTLLAIDEHGSKSLERVFLNAICRQSGDKWQSKTLFLTIFIYVRRKYERFQLPPIRCAHGYCRKCFTCKLRACVFVCMHLCSMQIKNVFFLFLFLNQVNQRTKEYHQSVKTVWIIYEIAVHATTVMRSAVAHLVER